MPILCRKHFQELNFWDLEFLHRVDHIFFWAVIFFHCSCLHPVCYCRAVVILSANTSPFVVAA